jgi:uncharacterized protein YoxC
MMQRDYETNPAHGDAGRRPSARPEWRDARNERTFMVMRNDLTVIRGQAQLMQRAMNGAECPDATTVRERLDAIISSVDEASLELQQLQSSARARQQRL